MNSTTTPAFCHRVIRTEVNTGRTTTITKFAANELAEALNLAAYHNHMIGQYTTFHFSVETIPTNTK